jgi:hypothetical protein
LSFADDAEILRLAPQISERVKQLHAADFLLRSCFSVSQEIHRILLQAQVHRRFHNIPLLVSIPRQAVPLLLNFRLVIVVVSTPWSCNFSLSFKLFYQNSLYISVVTNL